jgi:hypothetical protein
MRGMGFGDSLPDGRGSSKPLRTGSEKEHGAEEELREALYS